ncbi:unnamed protein product [Somion occarium]|uniref:Palmitoyl-protein thioesterase 1 n=1 Tax=Somion occarium TaxID=3059160 RepID=A0ABP1DL04_9APHY
MIILSLLLGVLALLVLPRPVVSVPTLLSAPHPRPLVLWHGLGDSYGSPGMLEFIQLVKDMHPGLFVHSVYIEENLKEDQKAGWFGNVNEQVANVSIQLAEIPELSNGFDALGFSQVHNLITFGSQHMGVSDLPLCRPWDVFCHLARRAARGGVYTEWAQENLVQAQYFRDADQIPLYLTSNRFLAVINNEVDDSVNTTYANNLASLNKLVLVLFSQDKTVVPKESSWFGSYAPPEEDSSLPWQEKTIIPMRLQPIYLDNRIGLKTLDERGDVVLETCDGEHMQLATECWEPIVKKFVGGLVEKQSLDSSNSQTFLHA